MTAGMAGERDLLPARLDDAVQRSEKGNVAVLPFLSPRERKEAERDLVRRGYSGRAWFFGGYPGAERVCLFLLPQYLADCLSAPIGEVSDAEMADLLGEDLTDAVGGLLIRGSGFRC